MPLWLREKLFQKDFCLKITKTDEEFIDIKKSNFQNIIIAMHQVIYPPFEEAVVLTLMELGSGTTTVAKRQQQIGNDKEIHFPHSLGLLYSAFTYYTGFKVNSGEYKVMGLAPYGKLKYKDLIIKELMDLKEDGSFKLNMRYFNDATGLTMTNKVFNSLVIL